MLCLTKKAWRNNICMLGKQCNLYVKHHSSSELDEAKETTQHIPPFSNITSSGHFTFQKNHKKLTIHIWISYDHCVWRGKHIFCVHMILPLKRKEMKREWVCSTSGLRSRCTTPCRWQNATTFSICTITAFASSSEYFPPLKRDQSTWLEATMRNIGKPKYTIQILIYPLLKESPWKYSI